MSAQPETTTNPSADDRITADQLTMHVIVAPPYFVNTPPPSGPSICVYRRGGNYGLFTTEKIYGRVGITDENGNLLPNPQAILKYPVESKIAQNGVSSLPDKDDSKRPCVFYFFPKPHFLEAGKYKLSVTLLRDEGINGHVTLKTENSRVIEVRKDAPGGKSFLRVV